MKGGRFSPGQAYVAFSRVKTLQGLHITNFDPQAIKKSDGVSIEMNRLKNNLIPTLKYVSLCGSHLTIALLNIRSIKQKLQDLQCDPMLK